MTVHKLTAGDGYTYLTRQVAGADIQRQRGQSAADYYTAAGNPPGRWSGGGLAALGLAGEVSERQMLALFGHGMHPDAEAMVAEYLHEHVRAGMSPEQLDRLAEAARKAATLGRAFPVYEPLSPFQGRVAARLETIEQETKRAVNEAERAKVRREESHRVRAAVAGFDLVFTPVKSASVLWALDERAWVRDAVKAAHDAARDQALALAERHAALTRRGDSGQAQITTHGLIAAAFDHHDSRLGDPNLHTHVAVSSKVLGTDGQWSALDARVLYRIGVAASERYNTAFEQELRRRLGVEFTERPDTQGGREPVREISGVDPAWIEHFARRRAVIEDRYEDLVAAYRAQHGQDPSASAAFKLAQQATLDTRGGKPPPVGLPALRDGWRQDFTATFGPDALTALGVIVPDRQPVEVVEVAPVVKVENLAVAAIETVQQRRSTWTRWNVRAEIERLLRPIPLASAADHEALAERITGLALAAPNSIAVTVPELVAEPDGLRRPDGTSVFVEHGADRFTSAAILDAEARLVAAARQSADIRVDAAAVTAALDAFQHAPGNQLSPDQRALAAAFATDPRRLVAGIGPAGSGKTTATRALAAATRATRVRLIPLATSAQAAAVLSAELGMPAENLHKFLHEWDVGPYRHQLAASGPVPDAWRRFQIRPGDLLLVDEAGMAGTLKLDRLVALAAERGAVVRLLGDHRQLGAVESGGALRLLVSETGAYELTMLHRFTDPAEAKATRAIREGDTSGLDFYQNAGRIRSGSRQAMAEAAYAGWAADMRAGCTSLMIAATTTDVTRLSAQARRDRVVAGQVEPGGVRLRDGNLAGVGDWITTRHNNRLLTVCGGRDFVKNGDGWRVLKRGKDGSLTVRHLIHGGRVRLPAAYVTAHVELLYATTTHRAQGTTVDTAHPLITGEMARENLYVALTRARHRTTLYVATHDQHSPDPDEHLDKVRADPDAFAAREVLERILANEQSELSATETIRTAFTDAESLAQLVPRYQYALDEATRQHIDTIAGSVFTPELADELRRDPAWTTVIRALRDAETAGWEPTDFLRTAATLRSMTDAESPTALLAWRIDQHVQHHEPPPPAAVPSTADVARYVHHLAALLPRLADVLDAADATKPEPEPPLLSHADLHLAPTRDDAEPESETATVTAALGETTCAALRTEPTWPALTAALRRTAENGWNPTNLLAQCANARSLPRGGPHSRLLAWRINNHLRNHQPSTHAQPWLTLARTLKAHELAGRDADQLLHDATVAASEQHPNRTPTLEAITNQVRRLTTDAAAALRPTPPLPWTSPLPADFDHPWAQYLTTRQHLIATRVQALALHVATTRPAWASHLGPAPADRVMRAEWLHHIGIIAAYREEFDIRDNHPDRPLGPYIEAGRRGHTAYWHAATAANQAHHLSHATPAVRPPDPAEAQVAIDLYRALPDEQRNAAAARMAAHLGPRWHGHPNHPDEAATQPTHAHALIAALSDGSAAAHDDWPHRTAHELASHRPTGPAPTRRSPAAVPRNPPHPRP